jgi:uncharacterized protein YecE (DUF72 family)
MYDDPRSWTNHCWNKKITKLQKIPLDEIWIKVELIRRNQQVQYIFAYLDRHRKEMESLSYVEPSLSMAMILLWMWLKLSCVVMPTCKTVLPKKSASTVYIRLSGQTSHYVIDQSMISIRLWYKETVWRWSQAYSLGFYIDFNANWMMGQFI